MNKSITLARAPLRGAGTLAMAATVAQANPVPPPVDQAASSLAAAHPGVGAGGVVPENPSAVSPAPESHKLQLSDFKKVRTLGTGKLFT